MQNRIFVLALVLIAPPLSAQPPAAPANAGSAAQARAPAYQSAFTDYRAWHEPAPMDWRTANREAGAIGGHMGQLRGGPPAKPPKGDAPAQPPTGGAVERAK